MTTSSTTTVHRLSVGDLRLEVSTETGAVVSLMYGDWAVLDRPELGESFRLLVPVSGRRANWVRGSQQSAPQCKTDESSITCLWQGVQDEHGTTHDIGVRTRITAKDGRIVFSVEIDNLGSVSVENVYFPDFGDVTAPPDSGSLRTFGYQYATARQTQLRPRFANFPGYFGVEHPTYTDGPMISTPQMPWVLLRDDQRGLYLGIDEPAPDLVSWFAELLPGYSDSLESTVPDANAIGGHPVALHVAAVHLPFVPPGEQRALTPIALAGFEGSWHAGVDHYVRSREQWGIRQASGPHWVRDPHSWLQFQMNSPEGERRTRFADLPAIAAECVEAGIGTIQLVGWNEGGQDQNNPCHDADEALGGRDELVRAIEQCHRFGVRVILFSKFTWADRATERFRDELIDLAAKDPYGDYYLHPGYRYQTVTQLLDINTKRLVPMCFGSERYLQICEHEFDKVVGYGADGMLYDEAQHHGPALLCFDPDHGHAVPYPVYSDDRQLIARLRRRPGVGPEFLFAGEAPYDWMFEEYELGYLRSENPDHIALSRYLRPGVQLMTAITGFDDRNMINQCLLNRYVMSFEPYNFKGRPTDAPETIQYGKQASALRTELREWLWDATFVDTVGVSAVRSDGRSHHPATGFRHVDGRLAAIVANYSDEPVQVSLSLDGSPATDHRYRLVDQPGWHSIDTAVELPPRSAAVALPAGAIAEGGDR